jgi:hypothetical protein
MQNITTSSKMADVDMTHAQFVSKFSSDSALLLAFCDKVWKISSSLSSNKILLLLAKVQDGAIQNKFQRCFDGVLGRFTLTYGP